LKADTRSLLLERLNKQEARELATLLWQRAAPGSPGHAAALAEEAGGHPLFIDELVRHTVLVGDPSRIPRRLDEALWARIERLDEKNRQLLEIVAIAGMPIHKETLALAAQVDMAEASKRVSLLRVQSLVRAMGRRDADAIETYHDRVREAVLRHISPEERRVVHERLALALEATGRADPESLSVHWSGAGAAERAAAYAIRAGDQAAELLAFDRAARLYRAGIDLAPEGKQDMHVKLASALAAAGRGREAAEEYRVAATDQNLLPDALDLQRRSAEQLLRSGHIDEGLSAVRAVLEAVDMPFPETPMRALLSLVYRRFLLFLRGLRFVERDESQIPRRDLTRIDACWSVSSVLTLVDTVRGADFAARHFLLALDAGEPYRIARALALEGAYAAGLGTRRQLARARRFQRMAAELSERIGHPHAIGWSIASEGVGAYLNGRYREALDKCQSAEEIFRTRCTGTAWEVANMQRFGLWALAALGEVRELSRRLPQHVREAIERGDLHAATNLRIGQSVLAYLAADDPGQGKREIAAAMKKWSKRGTHLEHYYELLAKVSIDLYQGRGDKATKRIEQKWKAFEAAMLFRVQSVHVQMLHMRARAHIALSKASGERLHLDQALADARRMEKTGAAWALPLALLARAGALRVRGDHQASALLAEKAATLFDANEMKLYAAAARGDIADLHARGVKAPEKLVACLAPGL
jgi:TPR repeat protein